MKKKIFTMLAAMCSLVYVNAADKNVAYSNTGYADIEAALAQAGSGDIIRIEVGTYFAGTDELEIPAGVTVIGGYSGGWDDIDNRIWPGEAADITQMTVLDGNSLVNTLPATKHRVATVEGILEGCMIRNGHARENGGGVLVIGDGLVQNCIIKGNVAMDPVTNEALGGGAYLDGGSLINCVVAFNMANNGYGVAGTGKVVNNTISANTYAPVAVPVPGTGVEGTGTPFRHFKHWRDTETLPWIAGSFNETINLDPTELYLSDFSISQTETSTSQYAVFAAAMDLDATTSADIGYDVKFADTTFKLSELTDPFDGRKVSAYLGLSNDENVVLFRESAASSNFNGLRLVGKDFIYYASYANDAMTFVTWHGALAYSLWLGGTLPTESHWEYAARNLGVDTYLYAGSDDLDAVAWADNKGGFRIKEIATKASNGALDLYDMTGNAWEWCADLMNVTTTTGDYPTKGEGEGQYKSLTDPICILSSSPNRAFRGGAWNYNNGRMALSYRGSNVPTHMVSYLGFRPVLVP